MSPIPTRHFRSRPSGGFTQVELLVALAILSIILLATQSAVMLASRAVPDGRSAASAVVAGARGADMIAADLSYAASVTKATPTELIFTVADRNGDSAQETIRYAWSGVPGAALTRQYNGGAPVTVVENVQEFQLAYDKRVVPVPGPGAEGAETLLASSDGTGGLGTQTISTNNWSGQYIVPSLPAGATTWKLTRVKFLARSNGYEFGRTLVQIRTTAGGLPTGTVLDQSTMLESSLTSWYTWQEFSFTNVTGVSPQASLCLVFQFSANSPSCDVQQWTVPSPSGGLVETGDSGSSWSAATDRNLRYYVFGRATTPGPTTSQYLLTDVRCTVRAGSDPSARICTSVRVLNEPQVTGP